MNFNGQPRHTVGIEWELQLLDAKSFDLKPGIVKLMDLYPDEKFVKPEYIQSCVELNSRPGENMAEVRMHIESLLETLQRNCAGLGLALSSAGTHPFCKRLALITPLPRYLRIESEEGYLGHTQQTFAIHVHVAMRSGDEAMRVMSRLIPCVPVFIGLSANSPFWRGYDTAFAAYRHRILSATKVCGIPPYFDGWADFNEYYKAAVRCRSIEGFKDIHWDIRPHPDFGTLEFRVLCSQPTIDYTIALCAFVHALIAYFADTDDASLDPRIPKRLPQWMERENHFRATQKGLDAILLRDTHGRTTSVAELVDILLDVVADTAATFGSSDEIEFVREVIRSAPGYQQQREIYAETGSFKTVAASLSRSLAAPAATDA